MLAFVIYNKYLWLLMKISVVVIIFNRPDKTKLLFKSISKYKPKKLFIISDGSRKNFLDNFEKVKEKRDKINFWKNSLSV